MIIATIFADPARPQYYVVLDTAGNYWLTSGQLPGRRYQGDTASLITVSEAQARDLKRRWGNYL